MSELNGDKARFQRLRQARLRRRERARQARAAIQADAGRTHSGLDSEQSGAVRGRLAMLPPPTGGVVAE
jgi:hypothetical protein